MPGAPSSITTAVVGLLESAASGATINIAMYEADNGRVTNVSADTTLIKQAIKSAATRARAINIITDGAVHENQRFWNQLADVAHVHVERCDHACYYSGRSVMHNKFMTVDDTTWTPGHEDVVLQMTSNWRNPQLSSRLWNSALQLWGDQALYDGYARYFSALWGCAPSCHGLPAPQDFDGRTGSGVHVSLFPRRTFDDPVLAELNDVRDCTGGEVDIAMNGWVLDARGKEILQRLESLVAHGCFVRIVVRRTPGSRDMGSTLRAQRLAAMSHCTDGKESRMDTTHLTPAVHSKYILIRGNYRGVKGSTVVSTGSERFVSGSLNRADETWMTVTATPTSNPDNAAVYAAYEANFNAMWASTPAC